MANVQVESKAKVYLEGKLRQPIMQADWKQMRLAAIQLSNNVGIKEIAISFNPGGI